MLGTLRWRLQEAFEVFIGRKKTQAVKTNRGLALDSTSPEEFLNAHLELKILLESTNIEFCFSEFGENRVNAGGSNFVEKSRLDRILSSDEIDVILSALPTEQKLATASYKYPNYRLYLTD